jgi:hypothetical protein
MITFVIILCIIYFVTKAEIIKVMFKQNGLLYKKKLY